MKTSIIGSGAIGSLLAAYMAEISQEVLLVDQSRSFAQGRAKDLSQAYLSSTFTAGTIEDIKDSACVIITASVPYTNLSDRLGLIRKNAKIIETLAEQIARFAPETFVLMITNPVDVMTTLFQKSVSWPKQKIIGLSGELTKRRFIAALTRTEKLDVQKFEVPVIGAHWPNPLILSRLASYNNRPLSETVEHTIVVRAEMEASDSGAAIIRQLQNASTTFAPAVAAFDMIRSIFSKQTSPLCGSVVRGHLSTGWTVSVGEGKIRDHRPLALTSQEQVLFETSTAQTEKILLGLGHQLSLESVAAAR